MSTMIIDHVCKSIIDQNRLIAILDTLFQSGAIKRIEMLDIDYVHKGLRILRFSIYNFLALVVMICN